MSVWAKRGAAALLMVAAVSGSALRADPPQGTGERAFADFRPDPASVERFGPAFKYPQAGWVVLHIEGQPYERGYQHGRLMAGEIVDLIQSIGKYRSPTAPSDGYRDFRLIVNGLFLRQYDQEWLEEMKGIAAGAADAGAKYDGRAVDLLDVVAINSEIEVDFLDNALENTKTGLEGKSFSTPNYSRKAPKPPEHCSSFIATGPATADGKIVFGHITMWNLYQAEKFNVWIDVKPAKGHRVGMHSYPGGIMSGMDYYYNDDGICMSETTISQTPFNAAGKALASRCRSAMQYGSSIDDVVRLLGTDNNGLYTNEWLIGDTKTNEIAMFELGTHKNRLWRSSKNEWLGGTTGFYWGCNNPKDLDVRLETHLDLTERPSNLVFRPSDRDAKWIELYQKHKGKIGVAFGFEAFTTPPLSAAHSLDAKFTTASLVKEMKTWALFGPPLGRTWHPTPAQQKKFDDIVPLVSNDWTIIDPKTPAASKGAKAVDLAAEWKRNRNSPPGDSETPAWKGTLLPKSDADVWLASAFAGYERTASLAKSLEGKAKDGKLSDAAKERLELTLFAARSSYFAAVVRSGRESPLRETKQSLANADWFDVAANKGVLFLHELRGSIGAAKFDAAMTQFGKAYAGKEVATSDFRTAMEKAAGKELGAVFDSWLGQAGIPGAKARPYWACSSYLAELNDTVIVQGTRRDVAAQVEAAQQLQDAIRWRWSNHTVPIVRDADVTEAVLRTKHLLLIGRPETNHLAAKIASNLPIHFGTASFELNGKVYANPATAVVVAAASPFNPRYSVVAFAGLSAEATRRCAQQGESGGMCEAVLMEAKKSVRNMLIAAPKPAPPIAGDGAAKKIASKPSR